MTRKNILNHEIVKSRRTFPGFAIGLSIVFVKFGSVIKFKLLVHETKCGEQARGGLVPLLLVIQHLDRLVIREDFFHRSQYVAAVLL